MDKAYALSYLRGWFWNNDNIYNYILNMDIKRFFTENDGEFKEITKEQAIKLYDEINEKVKTIHGINNVHMKIYKK